MYKKLSQTGIEDDSMERSLRVGENLLAFSPMLRYHKNSYLRMSSLYERICGSGMTCPPEEGT